MTIVLSFPSRACCLTRPIGIMEVRNQLRICEGYLPIATFLCHRPTLLHTALQQIKQESIYCCFGELFTVRGELDMEID